MNAAAMEPFGQALLAYFKGDEEATILVRRDDGMAARLPASHFFRGADKFTRIEQRTLGLVTGRVLDIGAGTGIFSLVLQQRGLAVTAMDICPQAVEVMNRRGVKDAVCADVFGFHGGEFDTVLMMGHGLGMVESLGGLDRFLRHAKELVANEGHLLLDSLDVRQTTDPVNVNYHEQNRSAGRYIGEVRMQFEFRREMGPPCGWLQLDPETLRDHALEAGWDCQVLLRETSGDYLARLSHIRNNT